jgi:hypothetical protein
MGRRSTKNAAPIRAASIDDAIRAAIIRDCIGRNGYNASNVEASTLQCKLPEQEPTSKRQKLDEAAPAGYAVELMRSADAQHAAKGAKGVVELPWPVQHFAVHLQSSTLEEFSLSPMETELVHVRQRRPLPHPRRLA